MIIKFGSSFLFDIQRTDSRIEFDQLEIHHYYFNETEIDEIITRTDHISIYDTINKKLRFYFKTNYDNERGLYKAWCKYLKFYYKIDDSNSKEAFTIASNNSFDQVFKLDSYNNIVEVDLNFPISIFKGSITSGDIGEEGFGFIDSMYFSTINPEDTLIFEYNDGLTGAEQILTYTEKSLLETVEKTENSIIASGPYFDSIVWDIISRGLLVKSEVPLIEVKVLYKEPFKASIICKNLDDDTKFLISPGVSLGSTLFKDIQIKDAELIWRDSYRKYLGIDGIKTPGTAEVFEDSSGRLCTKPYRFKSYQNIKIDPGNWETYYTKGIEHKEVETKYTYENNQINDEFSDLNFRLYSSPFDDPEDEGTIIDPIVERDEQEIVVTTYYDYERGIFNTYIDPGTLIYGHESNCRYYIKNLIGNVTIIGTPGATIQVLFNRESNGGKTTNFNVEISNERDVPLDTLPLEFQENLEEDDIYEDPETGVTMAHLPDGIGIGVLEAETLRKELPTFTHLNAIKTLSPCIINSLYVEFGQSYQEEEYFPPELLDPDPEIASYVVDINKLESGDSENVKVFGICDYIEYEKYLDRIQEVGRGTIAIDTIPNLKIVTVRSKELEYTIDNFLKSVKVLDASLLEKPWATFKLLIRNNISVTDEEISYSDLDSEIFMIRQKGGGVRWRLLTPPDYEEEEKNLYVLNPERDSRRTIQLETTVGIVLDDEGEIVNRDEIDSIRASFLNPGELVFRANESRLESTVNDVFTIEIKNNSINSINFFEKSDEINYYRWVIDVEIITKQENSGDNATWQPNYRDVLGDLEPCLVDTIYQGRRISNCSFYPVQRVMASGIEIWENISGQIYKKVTDIIVIYPSYLDPQNENYCYRKYIVVSRNGNIDTGTKWYSPSREASGRRFYILGDDNSSYVDPASMEVNNGELIYIPRNEGDQKEIPRDSVNKDIFRKIVTASSEDDLGRLEAATRRINTGNWREVLSLASYTSVNVRKNNEDLRVRIKPEPNKIDGTPPTSWDDYTARDKDICVPIPNIEIYKFWLATNYAYRIEASGYVDLVTENDSGEHVFYKSEFVEKERDYKRLDRPLYVAIPKIDERDSNMAASKLVITSGDIKRTVHFFTIDKTLRTPEGEEIPTDDIVYHDTRGNIVRDISTIEPPLLTYHNYIGEKPNRILFLDTDASNPFLRYLYKSSTTPIWDSEKVGSVIGTGIDGSNVVFRNYSYVDHYNDIGFSLPVPQDRYTRSTFPIPLCGKLIEYSNSYYEWNNKTETVGNDERSEVKGKLEYWMYLKGIPHVLWYTTANIENSSISISDLTPQENILSFDNIYTPQHETSVTLYISQDEMQGEEYFYVLSRYQNSGDTTAFSINYDFYCDNADIEELDDDGNKIIKVRRGDFEITFTIENHDQTFWSGLNYVDSSNKISYYRKIRYKNNGSNPGYDIYFGEFIFDAVTEVGNASEVLQGIDEFPGSLDDEGVTTNYLTANVLPEGTNRLRVSVYQSGEGSETDTIIKIMDDKDYNKFPAYGGIDRLTIEHSRNIKVLELSANYNSSMYDRITLDSSNTNISISAKKRTDGFWTTSFNNIKDLISGKIKPYNTDITNQLVELLCSYERVDGQGTTLSSKVFNYTGDQWGYHVGLVSQGIVDSENNKNCVKKVIPGGTLEDDTDIHFGISGMMGPNKADVQSVTVTSDNLLIYYIDPQATKVTLSLGVSDFDTESSPSSGDSLSLPDECYWDNNQQSLPSSGSWSNLPNGITKCTWEAGEIGTGNFTIEFDHSYEERAIDTTLLLMVTSDSGESITNRYPTALRIRFIKDAFKKKIRFNEETIYIYSSGNKYGTVGQDIEKERIYLDASDFDEELEFNNFSYEYGTDSSWWSAEVKERHFDGVNSYVIIQFQTNYDSTSKRLGFLRIYNSSELVGEIKTEQGYYSSIISYLKNPYLFIVKENIEEGVLDPDFSPNPKNIRPIEYDSIYEHDEYYEQTPEKRKSELARNPDGTGNLDIEDASYTRITISGHSEIGYCFGGYMYTLANTSNTFGYDALHIKFRKFYNSSAEEVTNGKLNIYYTIVYTNGDTFEKKNMSIDEEYIDLNLTEERQFDHININRTSGNDNTYVPLEYVVIELVRWKRVIETTLSYDDKDNYNKNRGMPSIVDVTVPGYGGNDQSYSEYTTLFSNTFNTPAYTNKDDTSDPEEYMNISLTQTGATKTTRLVNIFAIIKCEPYNDWTPYSWVSSKSYPSNINIADIENRIKVNLETSKQNSYLSISDSSLFSNIYIEFLTYDGSDDYSDKYGSDKIFFNKEVTSPEDYRRNPYQEIVYTTTSSGELQSTEITAQVTLNTTNIVDYSERPDLTDDVNFYYQYTINKAAKQT